LVQALRAEIAVLRRDLTEARARIARLERAADPDADMLTTKQAAELAGRHEETVRQWCFAGKLGTYSGALRRWRIGRAELRQFMLDHFGEPLPFGLRERDHAA
jgi:excisionase family DNA binding protein